MSIVRGFTGFELGSDEMMSTGMGFVMGDGRARTGDFYMHLNENTGLAEQGGIWDTIVDVGFAALADSETETGKSRCFIRLNETPGIDIGVMSFNGMAGAFRVAAQVTTSLTFNCRGGTTVGTSSTATLSLGVWYRFDLTGTWTNLPASANYSYSGTLSVYTEAGSLIETVTVSPANQSGASFNAAAMSPALGAYWSTGGSANYNLDFDDWVWELGHKTDAASVSFYNAMRVTYVAPTGEGSVSDWTGDWRFVTARPRNMAVGVSTPEISTSTDEATHLFTHRTAASLGLTAIQGVVVRAHAKASGGTGIDATMLNGVEYLYSANIGTTYTIFETVATGQAWGSMSNGTFDAMEFGIRNKRGVAIECAGIGCEVLHEGTDDPAKADRDGVESWKHRILTYTGDGSFQSITGVGFRPQVVIVKKTSGAGSGNGPGGMMFVDTGWGTMARAYIVSEHKSLGIMRATADGFDVGPFPGANESGVVYVALCIQDGGQHAGGRLMDCGYYLGDGIDNRDIVGRSGDAFTPEFVHVCSAIYHGWLHDGFAAGDSLCADSLAADQIQAYNADGFEIGTSIRVNDADGFIPYVYWRSNGLLDDNFYANKTSPTPTTTTYTVTGFPFQPYFAAIGGSSKPYGWRAQAHHTGTESHTWADRNVNTSTGITSFTSDGFVVGSLLAQNGIDLYFWGLTEAYEVEVTAVPWRADVSWGVGANVAGVDRGMTIALDGNTHINDEEGKLLLGGDMNLVGFLEIPDPGVVPTAQVGKTKLYIDPADGDLKAMFGDGTIKTIVTDT